MVQRYETLSRRTIRLSPNSYIDLTAILASSPNLSPEGPDPNPDGSEADAKYFTFYDVWTDSEL